MRKNKGISLIVLVITIIVIIILATAILVSVISNNPIEEANKARYESDRDNMQAVFTNTVGKIMAESQGVVNVTAGQINTETSGVNETTGEVAYTVDNATNEENASGTIIFDKGENTATTYYTGKKLPVYAAGETKWYVDSDGVMSLEVAGVMYGSVAGGSSNGSTEETTPSVEAFAVYSADDNSLNFYKRETVPTEGDTFEGKTATAVYTGIEELKITTYNGSPWYSYAETITSVEVIDEISPIRTSYWFYEFLNCSTFEVGKLDTSNVTDMSLMFRSAGYNATTFEIIGLDNWDTLSVVYMSGMFYGAGRNATTFDIGDLSSWNVSKVEDMCNMFDGAGRNADWSLDCSNWNISNVIYYDDFNSGVESKVTAPTWVN